MTPRYRLLIGGLLPGREVLRLRGSRSRAGMSSMPAPNPTPGRLHSAGAGYLEPVAATMSESWRRRSRRIMASANREWGLASMTSRRPRSKLGAGGDPPARAAAGGGPRHPRPVGPAAHL